MNIDIVVLRLWQKLLPCPRLGLEQDYVTNYESTQTSEIFIPYAVFLCTKTSLLMLPNNHFFDILQLQYSRQKTNAMHHNGYLSHISSPSRFLIDEVNDVVEISWLSHGLIVRAVRQFSPRNILCPTDSSQLLHMRRSMAEREPLLTEHQ